MKRGLTQNELIEHWTLAPTELVLLMNKIGPGHLGFALLLKFFQVEGRFPSGKGDVPEEAIEYVARQTKVAPAGWDAYDWQGRTIKCASSGRGSSGSTSGSGNDAIRGFNIPAPNSMVAHTSSAPSCTGP
jgi:hypothetical protein